MLLVYPPVSRPCEPPAGIARLAGTIDRKKHSLSVVDANLDALLRTVNGPLELSDTWTRRSQKNLHSNLNYLRKSNIWNLDKYKRAVLDINRLFAGSLNSRGIKASLVNYTDKALSPVKSLDLLCAAEFPDKNPFYSFFKEWLVPQDDNLTGISLNFMSQALTAFSMMGYIRKHQPGTRIILGGGLVTSWMKIPEWKNPFEGLVNYMEAGPGEACIKRLLGVEADQVETCPDYDLFPCNDYISPGMILPYSASSGCFWQKCSFCPEKAEGNPYIPVHPERVSSELEFLTGKYRPALVHFLDNAMSPSLLKHLAKNPLNYPWYGFVRVTDDFKDPDFCMSLKRSGCVMLKMGIESGNQDVVNAMEKGIDLKTVSVTLENLKKAGIGTYLYFLFGTPFEGLKEARHTMDFIRRHHDSIDFMNISIFNLPAHGPDAERLRTFKFYEGDLSLYSDFEHPKGWNRAKVRAFLDSELRKDKIIRAIEQKNPLLFTSSHAPFFTESFS